MYELSSKCASSFARPASVAVSTSITISSFCSRVLFFRVCRPNSSCFRPAFVALPLSPFCLLPLPLSPPPPRRLPRAHNFFNNLDIINTNIDTKYIGKIKNVRKSIGIFPRKGISLIGKLSQIFLHFPFPFFFFHSPFPGAEASQQKTEMSVKYTFLI